MMEVSTVSSCEYCGREIVPAPYLQGRPSQAARLRFCSRQCAAKSKSNRVLLQCPVCHEEFLARACEKSRRFCSNACYQVHHAATPRICPTCGRAFVPRSYNKQQVHCCQACVPMTGPDNPNYGKRRPNMFSHSAEVRRRLSVSRLGAGNPRWDGGRWGTGKYRMQTWVSRWAAERLGTRCAVCGAGDAVLHHIVARTHFQHVIMAHFRQNLVMLCVGHHAEADKAARVALKAGTVRGIPFSDRLPESILAQLAQDGSVSQLPRECDFEPIGNAAESMILPEWYDDRVG